MSGILSTILSIFGVILSLVVLFNLPTSCLSSSVPLVYTKIEENPLYILVLGLDREIDKTRRTDVIMIVGIDLKRKKVVLSSVPRDLLVDGVKINSIYSRKGLKGLEKVLEKLTGVKINRYVIFDYSAFKLLGDELGPVEIEVKKPMIYHDYAQNLKIEFKPGVYEMYGDQLLAYIRYRKGGMGDIDRISKERYVVEKLAQRARELPFEKLVGVAEKLLERIDTNFEIGEISYILLNLKSGFDMVSIQFPYKIRDDGSVVLDVSRLKIYRKEISSLESFESEEKSFIVLNNSKSDPFFFERTLRIWKDRIGYQPKQVFWENLNLNVSGNVVLSSDESVMKIIEKVYPNRKFSFLNLKDIENLEIYYTIVAKLSSSRLYPKLPADAIVLVGSR